MQRITIAETTMCSRYYNIFFILFRTRVYLGNKISVPLYEDKTLKDFIRDRGIGHAMLANLCFVTKMRTAAVY